MRTDNDPTAINLQTNFKKDKDPTIQRMSGYVRYGMTPFDVPFISHIEGNLWQGGCKNGLHLPKFFKHLISLYPWERYKVEQGQLSTEIYIEMFDSLDQSMEQIDALATIINECIKTGPTLVHCQAGLNRSSLLSARALMLKDLKISDQQNAPYHLTADEAIKLLRDKRSPACLSNKAFERYLWSCDA